MERRPVAMTTGELIIKPGDLLKHRTRTERVLNTDKLQQCSSEGTHDFILFINSVIVCVVMKN